MKKQLLYFLMILLLFGILSCKKDKQKEYAQQIVAEWIDKTVTFPSDIPLFSIKEDTISLEEEATPYKVLLFTDSTGCTSCKLHLYKWNSLIEEVDSTMAEKLSFQFYFHPQDAKELKFLLKRDNFTHPVFLDIENRMDKENKFPSDMNFQCFLLDKDNKVLLIGNPTLNPQIWNLYKQAVGEKVIEEISKPKILTTVELKQAEIELDNLEINKTSMAIFVLKNTGNSPLLISDIDASCGCTVPKWDKKPIKPNEETEIEVAITPDTKGYFNKTVSVFCNTEQKIIRLSIKGMTKE